MRSAALILLVLVVMLSTALVSAEAFEKGRVVLVILDYISLDDLRRPCFEDILSGAAIGLMNNNTGGPRNEESTYATIGAGNRVVATRVGFEAYQANERIGYFYAGDEFYRRMGIKAPPGSVVHLEIVRLHQRNNDTLGALGQALHQAGLKTAVLGNADWNGEVRRHAATITMDERGVTDQGIVSTSILVKDAQFPYLYRTDYAELFRQWQEISDADFCVIELGDTSRLEASKDVVAPEVWEEQKTLALQRASEFLVRLRRSLQPKDLLIVVTPTPTAHAVREGNLLTPVIMIGNEVRQGLLTSPSTKRPGIVVNTDLAPTILAHLGVKQPVFMAGRPLDVKAEPYTLRTLDSINNSIITVHNVRVPLIKGYTIVQIILVVVGLLSIIYKDKPFLRKLKLPYLVLAVMSFPVAALLVASVPNLSAPVIGLGLLGIIGVITAVSILIRRCSTFGPLVFLTLITAGVIIGDLFWGMPLQKHSIFSYDVIGGARFYGLGNEYMGVLTGAVILGSASLMTVYARYRRLVLLGVAGLFLLTLYAIASPNLGANFGGTITGAVAFLVTLTTFAGIKFNRKVALAITGGVLVFLAGLGTYDFLRGAAEQSHIGRAISLLVQGNFQEIREIITRKLSMNLKLIKYTIWSRVFLVSLAGLGLLFYRPIGGMCAFRNKYPTMFKGFVGIVVASFVTLIVNDSGIVAAATTMIFGLPPLIYFFMEDQW